ncbi:MAG: hypothetical protein WDW38_006391 [Sanguina aurantia]
MEIVPGLFLGTAMDGVHMTNVDMVVNCTSNLRFHAPMARRVRFAVEDNGDPAEVARLATLLADLSIFVEIQAVLAREGVVLVHCRLGQQRSAAVVAAYLMYSQRLAPEAAINFVRSKKPDAFFFQANFAEALVSLHAVLEQIPQGST